MMAAVMGNGLQGRFNVNNLALKVYSKLFFKITSQESPAWKERKYIQKFKYHKYYRILTAPSSSRVQQHKKYYLQI